MYLWPGASLGCDRWAVVTGPFWAGFHCPRHREHHTPPDLLSVTPPTPWASHPQHPERHTPLTPWASHPRAKVPLWDPPLPHVTPWGPGVPTTEWVSRWPNKRESLTSLNRVDPVSGGPAAREAHSVHSHVIPTAALCGRKHPRHPDEDSGCGRDSSTCCASPILQTLNSPTSLYLVWGHLTSSGQR